uniref:Uncharacterized protein n=1 Tax=Octopus bimaculoides TaxID=37653 RepID=A0A0L8FPX2_OCTBM
MRETKEGKESELNSFVQKRGHSFPSCNRLKIFCSNRFIFKWQSLVVEFGMMTCTT